MTKTFADRCKMFEQCLPDASYRDLLKALHAEMLAKLAEQPAQQEPCGYEHHEHRPYGAPGEVRIHAVLASQYKMLDGTVANDFQWLIDAYKADPTTIKLLPLYNTTQAQPAREWVGLTEEEFQWIYDHGRTPAGMMEMVEAKLMEKNT